MSEEKVNDLILMICGEFSESEDDGGVLRIKTELQTAFAAHQEEIAKYKETIKELVGACKVSWEFIELVNGYEYKDKTINEVVNQIESAIAKAAAIVEGEK